MRAAHWVRPVGVLARPLSLTICLRVRVAPVARGVQAVWVLAAVGVVVVAAGVVVLAVFRRPIGSCVSCCATHRSRRARLLP